MTKIFDILFQVIFTGAGSALIIFNDWEIDNAKKYKVFFWIVLSCYLYSVPKIDNIRNPFLRYAIFLIFGCILAFFS